MSIKCPKCLSKNIRSASKMLFLKCNDCKFEWKATLTDSEKLAVKDVKTKIMFKD